MYAPRNHGWPSPAASSAVAIKGVSPLAKMPENWYAKDTPL